MAARAGGGVVAFDKFMVVNEIASNAKVARLTDQEFRCLLQGVWPMASKSSPRGYLLVGSLAAEASDVANQARCTVAVAKKTLKKLRDMGMIVLDSDTGWEFCHDWDEINPSPRNDPTNAERQAKFRARRKAESGGESNVTRNGRNGEIALRNAREVEVEEEEQLCSRTPNTPRTGGGRAASHSGFGDWADQIAGVLQRGVDSLTTDEPCRRPTAVDVLRVIEELSPSWDVALAVAVDVREIVQSQNRAPNVVGLYRQRLRVEMGRAA